MQTWVALHHSPILHSNGTGCLGSWLAKPRAPVGTALRVKAGVCARARGTRGELYLVLLCTEATTAREGGQSLKLRPRGEEGRNHILPSSLLCQPPNTFSTSEWRKRCLDMWKRKRAMDYRKEVGRFPYGGRSPEKDSVYSDASETCKHIIGYIDAPSPN